MKVVLMKNNIKEFDEIQKLSTLLGIPMQVSASIRPTMNLDNRPLKLRADENDIEYVYRILNKNFPEDNLNPTIDIENDRICNAGFNSISINPYGDVHLCISLGESIGNIREQSIKEIWNTSLKIKEWRKHRFKTLETCCNCEILQYCNFCPAQSYLENDGFWNRPYEEACKLAKIHKQVIITDERRCYDGL